MTAACREACCSVTLLFPGVPIGCFPDLYKALAGNMPDQVITL